MIDKKIIHKRLIDGQPDKYVTSRRTLADELSQADICAPDGMRDSGAMGDQTAEKKKARKRDQNDRLKAALINSIGRILAQIIGAIVGVILGIMIAGQMTGSQNLNQVKQSIPGFQPDPQGLSESMEYAGQIHEKPRVILVAREAAPEALRQWSITERSVVIINHGKGGFILHIEPAQPPQ